MTQNEEVHRLRTALALIRITLGVIILVTWWENLRKGIYTGDGIEGLFEWLFDAQNGNGSTLTAYKSILDATVLRAPGLFAGFQLVAEFLMGLGLLVGGLTPLAGAGATLFFANLFLAYFGGMEWIWVYVLLTAAAFVVSVTRSGRCVLGFDQFLVARFGEPPLGILW